MTEMMNVAPKYYRYFMKKYFLIGLLIVVSIACKKTDDELIPVIENFPTTIGTEWVYDRLIIVSRFQNETDAKAIRTDTLFQNYRVWVEKDTLLNDTMNVKLFKTRDNDEPFTSSLFRFLDGEGLKTYAYSHQVKVETKNGLFNIPSEPLIFFRSKSHSKDIIVEEIPLLDLKLPLKSRYAWIYKQPTASNPMQIVKYISGAETLVLKGNDVKCLKITWQYQNNPSYNGIKMTEWVSAKGFMKVSTMYPRSIMTNQDGDPVGYFQLTDLLILKDVIIP
jgi:hypothetical protein